ncbi:DUF349 domain-containing protein [Marinobacter halophilus]|uniref:DUF349 domain-containing protein n=1 Tax=Marinobacter halophilus TaxID=1323740 RepID=A0A2T1KC14_9GAMM|nr:DUF349 domain-containing protein [Marinobacter halophilus]PSF07671.1 DUF349 domain-containing protein [Marinobacter halophilus]GGC55826.1 hypothetical protein GCM10011362_00100 [Marinobacter halophilus]
MAAFIQKLFKSRKATPVTSPRAPTKSEPAQPKEQDTRQQLKEQQEQQLRSNPDQPQLATLALEGVTAALRLDAANRIHDEAQLQQVQKQAKGRDKSVYQTVKQALQSLKERQAAEASTREKVKGLIRQVQDQSVSEDTKLYQARLDALQESWRIVESQANPEQAQQFLEAVHQCRDRLNKMEQARHEEARHQEQTRQRSETLALLRETLTDLKSQDAAELPSVSALDAFQKTQENRWLEATRETQVGKQEQKDYEQHMLSFRNYLNAVNRLSQAKEAINELAEAADTEQATDAHRDAATALLKQIDWPTDFPQPVSLSPVRKLAGKPKAPKPADANQEKQKALAEALQTSLPELEAALEARLFKESRQLIKLAQNQFQQLDQRHRKPLQARMQLLNGQFRELSDWQGFATEPKQIALCEQMEYLADQPMEPEAKAERIKDLQNEWRDLGGSSDRALWSRFKAASDAAYEPCKVYFEAKSGLKQANLDKRNAICDQLDTFLANADWTVIDWKAAERIHQTAREEWKGAWPVDFRDNRPVQKRFDELLKKLERPLDQERQNNEALKQTVVEKAQALINHEPLQEAMEQAKALQNDWKAVGITRHREDRKLWQAFRKACDQIFARRDAERSAQQEATQHADQAARETLTKFLTVTVDSGEPLLDEARAAVAQLSGETLSPGLRDQLQQLRQRLNSIAQEKALQKRITTWQTLVTGRGRAQLSSEAVPEKWISLYGDLDGQNGRDLAIRAEILAGASSPEQDQTRRMEIQVQRLTDGMGNGVAETPIKELEKLVALWCLQPDNEDITPENGERLNQALATLLQAD